MGASTDEVLEKLSASWYRSPPMSDLESDQSSGDGEHLGDKERAVVDDEELQQQYRREYFRQLRQRQCPGCGEDHTF